MDYRSIQKPPIFKYGVRSNVAARAKAQQAVVPPKIKPPKRKPPQQAQAIAKAPVAAVPNRLISPVPKVRQAPNRIDAIKKSPIPYRQTFKPQIPNKNLILGLKNTGRGRVLIIIANGPSIKEIDFSALRAIIENSRLVDTMTINNPHNELWPTKYWMFADNTQYGRYKQEFKEYEGTIINTNAIRKRKENQVNIKYKGGKGFSRDLEQGFYLGRSTTFAALQVALYMDYKQIFVLGMDMSAVGNQMHYYGQNLDVDNKTREKRFNIEATYYQHAVEHELTPEEKNRIWICSQYNPFDFVNAFNRTSTQNTIEQIKNSI